MTDECLVTCSSCTTTVQIPPTSFERVEITYLTQYRLETTSGEVYRTTRLTRDETGFQVIVGENPIHVSFENVKSLERIDENVGATVLLTAVLAAGIVGAVVGIIFIVNPSI